ncbi:branched-chain-amino-acid aminotransferase 2, chloroplastic-like [Oryza brachyantha]|uniref:branched-chain-amino-acid aminotransferase 2, chloroplastic-like n=1 Tax=Oryza brachyantha TaxID=4533 RepID=UPI0003EAE05F|nr:branched-chain-amino-acid aminotransferase 2, chloroplastic-like [Oryza brachyantha]
MAAASSASSAKRALLPWARDAHHALTRVLQGSGGGGGGGSSFRGALPTLAAGRWSLLQRRWRSSLPQLDSTVDRSDEDSGGDIDWDNLGFGLTPTDYMYVMRCSLEDGVFSRGQLSRYGNIELSPSSGVINYGQGLFEGLKAYRKSDRQGYMLFRPEENARRMQHGAERMCMPSPSVEQFVHAVKQTVLANRRWVPPQGKGALYIRPLLIGSGPILGLAPAPEYTFLIYAAPVGTYFKEGLAPINLVVEDAIHRAMPGGTGGVKTITNYAPVLKAQMDAKSKGFTDVLYLDAVHKRYLEEASSCNLFIVKDGVVATPATVGTILPGITRKSVIELARDRGYQVEERLVSIDDLISGDEVFCTGTAVVIAPVSTVSYQGQRYEFRTGQDTLSQTLHTTLTSIQMGLAEDKKGWTVAID